jgi:hypothetical protein
MDPFEISLRHSFLMRFLCEIVFVLQCNRLKIFPFEIVCFLLHSVLVRYPYVIDTTLFLAIMRFPYEIYAF